MTRTSATPSKELFTSYTKPWTPQGYQKKAVKFLLERACAALFLDPGLGKTSISLAAIKMLKKRGLIDKVLIIAPLRVCHSVWPKEITKWAEFSELTISILHGKDKEKNLEAQADIYIINPEGLDWLLQSTKVKSPKTGKVSVTIDVRRFKSFGFDTLVVDELSKFKHTGSQRFKAIKQVLHTFQRRWGLTGSPAANGLLDLFGQCYVLDQGRSLGQYITQYRMNYFDQSYNGFTWTIRPGAEKEIYKRLNPLALRMAADDYLDMPKVIVNNIMVELPKPVMKIYTMMEDHLIAQIENDVVLASTAAAASIKCRQVACGGIYLDSDVTKLIKPGKSDRDWINLHTEKVDALADLIDELQGSPLLVAYDFEHDLDRLKTKFGEDIPYIGGGVSTKRSSELERDWNAGKLPVLFGHPQSIAHGLNLQESGFHVCWHSLTWNYELYDQFIRRVLRQGNKSSRVFVHHILAEDTIDEVILSTLKMKKKGQNEFFQALVDLRKKRSRD